MNTLKQHQTLVSNKQILTGHLHSVEKQLLQLKNIDQHFADLIAKYHFPWQNISWLSHLQTLATEQQDVKPGIELQKIKLDAQKEIKVAGQLFNAQLIDMELEASYTALIHWLVILAKQPALLLSLIHI